MAPLRPLSRYLGLLLAASVLFGVSSFSLRTAGALDSRSIVLDEAQADRKPENTPEPELEMVEDERRNGNEDDGEEQSWAMAERLEQLGVLDDGRLLEFPPEAPLDAPFDITHQRLGTQHAPDHLLLPEYVARATHSAWDAKHVHTVWLGDLALMPERVLEYHTKGFNLTVYNSAEAVLDGFSPHVRRGFQLALPFVVGVDFLKLLLLYKHGGLVVDADTSPAVGPGDISFPDDCDVLFGKEVHLKEDAFSRPQYRVSGHPTYRYSRPFQLLNWAMVGVQPRNRHVGEIINGSLRHFLGMRDMVLAFVQDVAGSGLMSDYVALLHAERGLDYVAAFKDRAVHPVDGICMTEHELRGGWIAHSFLRSWSAGLYND